MTPAFNKNAENDINFAFLQYLKSFKAAKSKGRPFKLNRIFREQKI